jgi:methyl-accepting chemotaxis protein
MGRDDLFGHGWAVKSSRTTKPHKHTRIAHGIQARIALIVGAVSLVVVGALAWGLWHWVDTLLAGRPIDEYDAAHDRIKLGAAAMLLLIQGMLWFVSRYVARRVTKPAAALAEASERVAAGDLAVFRGATGDDDEMGRLSRAAEAMVLELRRLVLAIRESAAETAAMSVEITAGTEEMSASASEMANTSGDLSVQAADMARSIAESAVDAAMLMRNATRLADGARDGVERNTKLSALAAANRERLDASSAALASVGADAARSAESAESLAAASEEIASFVTLVRRIARQSKLLALNASMEAARAGEQGQGFAVVAAEIRKLATSSAEAAEKTAATVHGVLTRVEQARDASQRTRETLGTVQLATKGALESFAQVERAVRDAEGWTKEIERTAAESTELIVQATVRLDELARGTENFAASMQEVAAASEQQSASTQEITAAATALAEASRKLLELVSAFQLGTVETAAPPERMTPENPARRRTSEVAIGPTTETAVSGPTSEMPIAQRLLAGT